MQILALMSGSSMDGLDIGLIQISFEKGKLNYDLGRCETLAYNQDWIDTLSSLPKATAKDLANADMAYSRYMAELILSFLNEKDDIDYIALHGHTIFHEPENGFTFQLGNGGVLAAILGVPVVCDFRSADIGLGGKGTPLAPIVDSYFFQDYDVLINLGGICNLTFLINEKTIAWDVCPCNQILNYFTEKSGISYDEGGKIAAKGKENVDFFEILTSDAFYKEKYPKSLDNQYIKQNIVTKLDQINVSMEDQLHTTCVFVARQIKQSIQMAVDQENVEWPSKILLSGGSAFNSFLVDQIQKHCAPAVVSIPMDSIINYKEIILMALCAYLRVNKKVNTLSQVTGSSRNSIGGAIYESK